MLVKKKNTSIFFLLSLILICISSNRNYINPEISQKKKDLLRIPRIFEGRSCVLKHADWWNTLAAFSSLSFLFVFQSFGKWNKRGGAEKGSRNFVSRRPSSQKNSSESSSTKCGATDSWRTSNMMRSCRTDNTAQICIANWVNFTQVNRFPEIKVPGNVGGKEASGTFIYQNVISTMSRVRQIQHTSTRVHLNVL